MSSIIRGSDNFDSVYQVSKLDVIDLIVEKGIPSGLISMWSGTLDTIPLGWFLCDGTNGTPNLLDRFIIGAGNSYAFGAIGGSKDAVVVAHTHTQAAHTHTGTAASAGAHTHTINVGGSSSPFDTNPSDPGPGHRATTTGSSGAHTHTLTIAAATPVINSAGENGTDKNLPPYFALAYIMKS